VDEARKRLEEYGPNALEEKKERPLLKFLGYFWGPIPWMIEVALILSIVVKRWVDVVIIGVLLVFNAGIGFWQEYKASNALAALRAGLALKARVLRGGKWDEVEAANLVPGDIVRLRLGDIIPADVKLIEGEYISIDQAALTGESLARKQEDRGHRLLRLGGQAGGNGRLGDRHRQQHVFWPNRQISGGSRGSVPFPEGGDADRGLPDLYRCGVEYYTDCSGTSSRRTRS